ncbi:MAG: hypothetical protein ACOYKE_08075 [Ferruginibacter sp.]
MKKMFFAVAILVQCAVFAQVNTPIVLRVDYGFSNVRTQSGRGTGAAALGLGIEGFLKLKSTKMGAAITLNPHLSYLGTGYEASSGGDVRVKYLSLNMPISYVSGNINNYSGMAVIIGVGPFVSVATSGKFQVAQGDAFKKMSFGNSSSDNRKTLDAGWVLKTGFKMKKTYFGMQFNYGLSNVIPADRISNGNYIKTRNILFYLGYQINK